MVFSIFHPLSTQYPDLISAHVTDFFEAESYEYNRHWYAIGNFTLKIPASANGAGLIEPDMLLFVCEDNIINDCLIITSVLNEDGKYIVIKGTDLKALMSFRVTMFPQNEIEAGTYGFDVRQGSTASIIEGYVDYNCVNADDQNRNIYGLAFGTMSGGILNDTYMSRLQPLNEVIESLCRNADIGYDISFTPDSPYRYLFDTVPGVDRTSGNLANDQCVYASYLFNTNGISVERKVSERRNVIWVVNGSAVDDAIVTSVYKSSGSDVCSFMRRESILTANCDPDLTEMYANKETADQTDKTELSFVLADKSDYGKRFHIGDIITIIFDGTKYDKRVLSVHKRYTSSEKTISIDVGDIPVKKPLTKVATSLSHKTNDVKELALETAKIKKDPSGNAKSPFISPDEPGENAATGDFWAVQPTSTEVARLFILNNNGWEEIRNFTYGTTEPVSGTEGEYFCYIWAQRLSSIEQYVNGRWIFVSTGHTIFKDDTNTPPKTGDQWIKINNVNDKVAEALYQYSVEDEWVERYVFGGAVSIGAGLEYDAQGRLQIKLGEGVKFDNNGALTLDIEPVVNIEYGLVYGR